ncbi:MAG: hypothetical protein RI983_1073 [Bacteroidota bacterium]|jgi:hypothetical protein
MRLIRLFNNIFLFKIYLLCSKQMSFETSFPIWKEGSEFKLIREKNKP